MGTSIRKGDEYFVSAKTYWETGAGYGFEPDPARWQHRHDSARKTEKVTVKNPEISSLALKKGEKFQLKTTGNAVFQSTNKKVITITKKGMIRAKKAGRAFIKIGSKMPRNAI